MTSRETMRRLVVQTLALCVCLIPLLGCDRAQTLRFYNNTGRDAIIQLGWRESKMKRHCPYKEEAELSGVFPQIRVYFYFDQEEWIYDYVGGINWSPAWWAQNVPGQYQIERNGGCYYIPPDLSMPVETYPKQPKGYPKFPTRKKIEKD